MSNLCIGTGWCAQKEGHNNPQRSKLQNDPEWLERTWRPHIEAQITPAAWMLYHSRCDIQADTDQWYSQIGEQLLVAHTKACELPYRHDWAASALHGAVYSYTNGLDFLYIEQDCMVHNLPAVLEFARDKRMCYGYGPYSMYPGWAENSLMWVRNDTLQAFIMRAMVSGLMNTDGEKLMLEQVFHQFFKSLAVPWPFGYGRIRPIDFSQPVLYAQQLTENEIHCFQDALKRGW